MLSGEVLMSCIIPLYVQYPYGESADFISRKMCIHVYVCEVVLLFVSLC